MRRRPSLSSVLIALVALFLLFLLVSATSVGASATAGTGANSALISRQGLTTALVDPTVFAGPSAATGFARTYAAGARVVRLTLTWNSVVYGGAQKPSNFQAANPNDPAYHWQAFDQQITQATAAGLEPLVTVIGAPLWALSGQGGGQGGGRPYLGALQDFSTAATQHYDGQHGQARVRYWQVWNEPNARRELSPQRANGLSGVLLAPAYYRSMVNVFASAVHAVPGDLVVTAGIAPFSHSSRDIQVTSPFAFLRSFLCLDAAGHPACKTKVAFDILTVNPYTAGGPTHRGLAGDLSLGDLPQAAMLLRQAYAAGHIVSPSRPAFWVSEFAWDTQDTKPVDRGAMPVALEQRWVSEALYRMWSAGVSLATWIILRDEPTQGPNAGSYQCGLYSYNGPSLASDQPKPLLRAFRFPFYAAVRNRRLYVWGRTPASKAAPVTIEARQGDGWRRLATLPANNSGLFQHTLALPTSGLFRAQVGNLTSAPFRPGPTPDLQIQPFGSI